jgi:hypothetical protein
MDRSERIGTTVSAAGHASLIAVALFGGIFFPPAEKPPVASMQVSTVSASEYDALMAAAPKAVTDAPPQPSAPPETAEPVPEAATEAPPETAQPVPEDQAPPDAAPDVAEITPPEPVVTDAPPDELTQPATDQPELQVVTPDAQPMAAPVVAPVPNDAPSPDAQVSEEVTAAAEPVPADEPVVEEPPVEEAAPVETGQVLQTEENQDQLAVASSPRPRSRPAKPAPVEEAAPEAAAEPVTETAAAEDPAQDAAAVQAALEQAMAGEAADTPTAGSGEAANGPPMTSGETDALRVAVQECWNQGAISTDATRVVLTVRVQMAPDGRPTQMDLLSAEGGDDTATQIAYRTARSAISRCTKNGYPLPPEKYERWKVIDMIFDNQEGVR